MFYPCNMIKSSCHYDDPCRVSRRFCIPGGSRGVPIKQGGFGQWLGPGRWGCPRSSNRRLQIMIDTPIGSMGLVCLLTFGCQIYGKCREIYHMDGMGHDSYHRCQAFTFKDIIKVKVKEVLKNQRSRYWMLLVHWWYIVFVFFTCLNLYNSCGKMLPF